MKLDKRIQQAIRYNVKEILISKDNFNKLDEETKNLLKLNDTKITYDESQNEFICKF